MNEPPQQGNADSATRPTGGGDHAKPARHLITRLLLLIVLCALIGGGEYVRRTLHEIGVQLKRVDDFTVQLAKTGQKLGRTDAIVGQLQNRATEHETALETLYTNQAFNNHDWAFAEAADLLRIANHRLQFGNDVVTARNVLEVALSKLGGDDPRLAAVRVQIEQNIVALHAITPPNPVPLGVQLAKFISTAERLPLQSMDIYAQPIVAVNENEANTWWQRGVATLQRTMGRLIVIERTADRKSQRLRPSDVHLIHHTLKLWLSGIRMSLLSGDADNFYASIELARDWIYRYYDANDEKVADMLRVLNEIQTLDLYPELPDLSASLKALLDYHQSNNTDHNSP